MREFANKGGKVFNPFGDYESGWIAEQRRREDLAEVSRIQGPSKPASHGQNLRILAILTIGGFACTFLLAIAP